MNVKSCEKIGCVSDLRHVLQILVTAA